MDKTIDWLAIKAEYIGGGISQRKLADKYGIKRALLLARANREKWAEQRQAVAIKTQAKTEQKTANIAAENATIAERIRGKLLKHLEAEIDALPGTFGTESTKKTVTKEKGKDTILSKTLKLRDLVAAYNDLTNTDIKREKLEIEKKRIEEESW